MTEPSTQCLQDCLARWQSSIPDFVDLDRQLENYLTVIPAEAGIQNTSISPHLDSGSSLRSARNDGLGNTTALIDLYEQTYPLLEKAMWSGEGDFDALLSDYQALFREQETLIAQRGNDERHHFILSIPIADRPPHLRACLESIYQLCEAFGYGGKKNGVWCKVQIIVAEDSRDENNIRRDRELVDEYRAKGLQVYHFGLDEQYALLHALPPHTREQLGHLLTTQSQDRFYLKGQAANRNLSYLKFLQLTENKAKTLYYLVDSDQHFCVNRQTESGEEVVYTLNYFHTIDQIFRNTDTLMLTGKMVGDPPVSPSVMAANFLDDIIAFFTRLATLRARQTCQFHQRPEQAAGDAAYHDMARLFGFENGPTSFPYPCRLAGKHDHSACLKDFSQRLNSFFFGEHLTRKTWFAYKGHFTQLTPARTIYPGNYIVNYAGLKYIIPFGHLRLRMSGPTAGRLIAAEIAERFASFNMPNLHRRTTEAGLSDDFRPGVEVGAHAIDLTSEFERQFFGDLMLFSTEELVKRADVNQPFAKDLLVTIIDQKESELLALYQQKHDAITDKQRQLHELVFNADHWWQYSTAMSNSLQAVRAFIHNIERNFGERAEAWRQIRSTEHRAARKQQIIEALMHYRAERDVWDGLF